MHNETRVGSASLPNRPPEAWEPLLRFARLASRPLERFLQIQAASGMLLFVAAAIALFLANSPWAEHYFHALHLPLGFRIGAIQFERSVEWFINDALMVVFFFVVGLEIRREIHHGELSEWRRAALPAAAALGGMLAPAGIYLLMAKDASLRSGWGVPMATDIAFAVGILTLLGQRVPAALRVLLLALAVIDDLGAIVVIALFYSNGIVWSGLAVGALGFLGIIAMQRFGVRSKVAYILPGMVAWAGIYGAGVHPTIAGVIVGLMTPVRAWLGPEGFLVGVRRQIEQLSTTSKNSTSAPPLTEALRQVDLARREALSPSESLIATLHPWVAFGIMPIFALANAGVQLSGTGMNTNPRGVIFAVALGLVLGKPVGVLLAIGITLKTRIGVLPVGISWRHLLILGFVAGIGFTMALFIAQLAFSDPKSLDSAKIGVLIGSFIAAMLGLGLGWLLLKPEVPAGIAVSADEAESSTEI